METFSALLAICAGNSPVPGDFPTQRPVTRGFDVFFDLRLNKQLSKQSWGWWFETLSGSLWRQCNVRAGPQSVGLLRLHVDIVWITDTIPGPHYCFHQWYKNVDCFTILFLDVHYKFTYDMLVMTALRPKFEFNTKWRLRISDSSFSF